MGFPSGDWVGLVLALLARRVRPQISSPAATTRALTLPDILDVCGERRPLGSTCRWILVPDVLIVFLLL
jgi:hypothetical protein